MFWSEGTLFGYFVKPSPLYMRKSMELFQTDLGIPANVRLKLRPGVFLMLGASLREWARQSY